MNIAAFDPTDMKQSVPTRSKAIKDMMSRGVLFWCLLVFLFCFANSGFSLDEPAHETPDSALASGSASSFESMRSPASDVEERLSEEVKPEFKPAKPSASLRFAPIYRSEQHQSQNTPAFTRLKRAEMISLGSQVSGMALLQAADAWHTGRRPFANAGKNLRRAWTSAPEKDSDSYFYNYIGHPYTGSFTYNLMRSQNSSPLVSWLFSCSQSLIWEFALEATEQHPSVQDLLLTSNVGSLIGEASHRVTARLRKNGLSTKEKILVLLINPGYVLNNGFR
jgi:hypothetical protein